HELRDPGIAEQAHIRRRITGERREKLLVGGVPRQLLDPHYDVRMSSGELRQEIADHLAFPAHRPHGHDALLRARRAASGGAEERSEEDQPACARWIGCAPFVRHAPELTAAAPASRPGTRR